MKLSPLRTVKTLYTLAVLVRDPDRLSKVFEMADALATPEMLDLMADLLAKDPEGARALAWKGELGLQSFYLAQIPGPLSASLLAVGCLRLARYEMEARDALMDEIVRGWQMGKQARALFGVRWNELWSTPLADVRKQLGFTAAPLAALAA